METFEQRFKKKPNVTISYRKVTYEGVFYKRRLRISGFVACMLDEVLGTYIRANRTKFVVLDIDDIKVACEFLGIEFKDVNTYFHIDTNKQSFIG